MKNKQAVTVVSHAEILTYALANLTEKQRMWEERAEAIKAKDPRTAKEVLANSPYKAKIDVLMAMYAFETGSDYSAE